MCLINTNASAAIEENIPLLAAPSPTLHEFSKIRLACEIRWNDRGDIPLSFYVKNVIATIGEIFLYRLADTNVSAAIEERG